MRRDQRVRILQAVERAVRQFRTREKLWPLRVPAEPLVLETIVRRAFEDASFRVDVSELRSRSLLNLTWDDGTRWELWVLALDSGLKLYCDTDPEESRILASGRRDSEIDTDVLFLELLAESAGATFGIGISGGPPSRVRSPLARERLVEFFVHLFEVAGMEEEVRGAIDSKSGDFGVDVNNWLDRTLR